MTRLSETPEMRDDRWWLLHINPHPEGNFEALVARAVYRDPRGVPLEFKGGQRPGGYQFQGLSAVCTWDLTVRAPSTEHTAHNFRLRYWDVATVDAATAHAMVKVFDSFDSGMVALQALDGPPVSFGEYLYRASRVLHFSGVVVRKVWPEEGWVWVGADRMAEYVDNLIDTHFTVLDMREKARQEAKNEETFGSRLVG